MQTKMVDIMKLKTINRSDIEKEQMVCVYCGNEVDDDDYMGCCGESSDHFERGYFMKDGNLWTESEVSIDEEN